MTFLFLKLKIKPKICFKIISVCFAILILICSFLYPFTSDDIKAAVAVQENVFKALHDMFFAEAPRFFNIFMAAWLLGKKYKILFCLINPIVQLGNLYGLFYFVKGRRLNINSKADILPFLLIS